MSLYVFGWERGHQLSTYATDGGMGESYPNYAQLLTREGGVTPNAYVRFKA